MKKNNEYSYYRTEGLKNILSSIEDISTEYYKRIDFFKTIKTDTVYCQKKEYPRLFLVKKIDFDKNIFKCDFIDIIHRPLFLTEDDFPLDMLLDCVELKDFKDTFMKMREKIIDIERQNDKLYSDFTKKLARKPTCFNSGMNCKNIL